MTEHPNILAVLESELARKDAEIATLRDLLQRSKEVIRYGNRVLQDLDPNDNHGQTAFHLSRSALTETEIEAALK